MKLVKTAIVVGTLIIGTALIQGAENPRTRPSEPSVEVEGVRAVPGQINVQGYLTDSLGTPLDGTYYLTFRLHEDSTGTPYLWGESQVVDIDEGVFNAHIGAVIPIPGSVFTGEDRWLQIIIGGESLSPRTLISSVGNSFRSVHSDSVDHLVGPDTITGNSHLIPTLFVENTDSDGDAVEVRSGGDGLVVDSAGQYGLYVSEATANGAYVLQAGQNGFGVGSATEDAFHGEFIGGDGVDIDLAFGNGFRVDLAGSSGVYVGTAMRGMYVDSVTTQGVYVRKAQYNGVHVYSAGDDGIYVYNAGDDGVHVKYSGGNGINVEDADSHGIYIDRASNDGVHIDSVMGDGIHIFNSESDGLEMEWIDEDGVHIGYTGQYGVYVGISQATGFYVSNAGSYGVYVGSSDHTGVRAEGQYRGGTFLNDDLFEPTLYLQNQLHSTTPEQERLAKFYETDALGQAALRFYFDCQGTAYAYNGWYFFSMNRNGEYESFAATQAERQEIIAHGTAQLVDGTAHVSYSPSFAEFVTDRELVEVTVTPVDAYSGLYVTNRTTDGFTVKSGAGERNCGFTWMAMGVMKGKETRAVINDPDLK